MRMEHCLVAWQQQSPVVLLAYILPSSMAVCSEKQIQFSFAMYVNVLLNMLLLILIKSTVNKLGSKEDKYVPLKK